MAILYFTYPRPYLEIRDSVLSELAGFSQVVEVRLHKSEDQRDEQIGDEQDRCRSDNAYRRCNSVRVANAD